MTHNLSHASAFVVSRKIVVSTALGIAATASVSAATPPEVAENATVQSIRAAHFECGLPDDVFARSYNNDPWIDGFVPFVFDPDLSNGERRDMQQAMDWWTTTTGVKFVYRINEPDYIYVTRSPDANISWSRSIGRGGGSQNVEIADSHWNDHGIIAHELCHALGWFHEQSRPDRDMFVTIETDNIAEGRANQFNIAAGSLMLGNPYDYASIMHYRACSFSVCGDCDPDDSGCRTITTNDPDWQDQIGQRDNLSAGDIQDVSDVYGPRTARYVRSGGTGNGRLDTPYGSISTAMNAIPAGGFVLLQGGTYLQPGTYDRASVWRAHGSTAEIR